ncbi:MAG: hypothetical protein SNG81_10520 [Rikenellaceae bacterium]
MTQRTDSLLRQRCESLSPRERKAVVASMFGVFTAGFIYNLIMEFL